MNSLGRALVVLLALVGAASLLNPSAEKPRQKVKEATAERSQLAALLRLGDLTAFVSSYHSLGLASYTTANEKVLTMGAFGVVVFGEPSKQPPCCMMNFSARLRRSLSGPGTCLSRASPWC